MSVLNLATLAKMQNPTGAREGLMLKIQPEKPALNPEAPHYNESFRSSLTTVVDHLENMANKHGVAYSAFGRIPNGVIKIFQLDGVYRVQYTVIGVGVVGPCVITPITQPPGVPVLH